MTVIRVENLTKEYRLGSISHGTLREDLQSWWARMRGKEDPNSLVTLHHQAPSTTNEAQNTKHQAHVLNPHFLALDNVSFDVKQGDAIGIIGRNGAGKSTLLKILSRVTAPTSGEVKIKGRVASLLEVGTGFHPDLSGRENIFLNGTILGMKRDEIQRKFDEIVAFAEIEQFIDTPVKRYSSGMYVRLAFAVAAHLEPEILIVDEVLAVGDAAFQKKCLGKMGEVGREGRTVLFVSHNLNAIKVFCRQCICLQRGVVASIGPTSSVIDTYVTASSSSLYHRWQGHHKENPYLNLDQISISNSKSSSCNLFITDELELKIFLHAKQEVLGVAYEITVYSADDVAAFSSFSNAVTLKKGSAIVKCFIPPNILNNGRYRISVGISKNFTDFIVKLDDALFIDLLSNTSELGWQGEWMGVVRPKLVWDI